MKKLLTIIYTLLLSIISQARIADKDFISGKLIQIVTIGNGSCGQEGMLIVQTKNTFRFIYEYRKFDASWYLNYLNKNVKVVYIESISRETDCRAGIIEVTPLKER